MCAEIKACKEPKVEGKPRKRRIRNFFKRHKGKLPVALMCAGIAVMGAGGAAYIYRHKLVQPKPLIEKVQGCEKKASRPESANGVSRSITHFYAEKELLEACGEELEFGIAIPDSLLNAIMASGERVDIQGMGESMHYIWGIDEEALENLLGAFVKSESVAKLFVDSPGRFQEIASSLGKDSEYLFEALGYSTIADAFVENPGGVARGFEEIAGASGTYSRMALARFGKTRSKWESEAENERIRKLFAENREEFLEIIKAAGKGTSRVFGALDQWRVGRAFVENKAEFVKIAKAAGEETAAAFWAFDSGGVGRLLSENPEKIVELAKATGEGAGGALRTLHYPQVGRMFKKDPDNLIGKFRSIVESAGKGKDARRCMLAAFDVFKRGRSCRICNLFGKHPDEIVKIAKISGVNTSNVFEAIEEPEIGRLFATSPKLVAGKFAKIPKMAGEGADGVYQALGDSRHGRSKRDVRKLFIKHTDEVLEIAKAAGGKKHWKEGSEHALTVLGFPEVSKMFIKHRPQVVKLAKTVGPYSGDAFRVFQHAEMRELFERDPERLIRVFGEIAKSTGNNATSAFSGIGNRSALFVENVDGFVELTRETKENAGAAYRVLASSEIAKLFVENPKLVASYFGEIATAAKGDSSNALGSLWRVDNLFVEDPLAFVEIAKAARERTYPAFKAFNNGRVRDLFMEHRAEFLELAKAAGKGTDQAFIILGKEREVRSLFIEHRAEFVGIAKAAGESTHRAFSALGKPKIRKMFVEHPELFEVAKAAGAGIEHILHALGRLETEELFREEPERATKVLSKIGQLCGRKSGEFFSLFRHPDVSKAFAENPEGFVGLAEISAYYPVVHHLKKYKKERSLVLENLDRIPLNALIPHLGNSILVRYRGDWEKGRRLASSVGAHADDREICINFAYALDKLGEEKTKELYLRFGIEYFARYPPEYLKKMLEGGIDPSLPLLIVAYNKNDWNGAFYDNFDSMHFLQNHYRMLVVEMETELEFYGQLSKIEQDHGKIDTLIIGGHGSEGSISLGMGPEEIYDLTFEDLREMRKYKYLFKEKPTVILQSCSTGKDESAIGARISRIWDAKLFAPKEPTSVKEIRVDKETGEISEVIYGEKSAVFENGKEKQEHAGSLLQRIFGFLQAQR